MNSPCEYCEERQLGCHSKCSKYRVYDENNKRIRKLRESDANYRSYKYENILRIAKKKKWGSEK